MKTTAQDIARALVETCQSLPVAEHGSVVEAAMALLRERGLSKEIRTFPRTVRRILEREGGRVSALLSTASGTAEGGEQDLLRSIEQALFKQVDLAHEKDASLIGGALLRIGDERFDASIKGALDRMKTHLSVTSAIV